MTNRRSGAFMLSLLRLEREDERPLYRQIYHRVRRAVLGRQLPPGTRLPSTRELSGMLGVSRSTVVNAFEQLLAEGYVEARVGAGTYVAQELPEAFLQVRSEGVKPERAAGERTLAGRGQRLREQWRDEKVPAHPVFPLNAPDLGAFPMAIWARLAARRYRRTPAPAFGYKRPVQGDEGLREAIAAHLITSRGVHCDPEQILIVSGSQQGLYLAGQVLLDPGEAVWMEDPGYGGARAALGCAGATLVPVPVDAEGLQVAVGRAEGPHARVAYVTPSHQFPLGYTMSLARRLALLQWAVETDSWIVEDDYDSEYRYDGSPIAALHGLDRTERVVYLGTFSKVVLPGLRLGYLVAPRDLLPAFLTARSAIDLGPPLMTQLVMADFIREGHFMRHIRRMRKLYSARRDVLVEALREELGDILRLGPSDTGLQLAVWLPATINDGAVRRRAAARQVTVFPLSWMYGGEQARSGLLLGFGSANEDEIRAGVTNLAAAIREVQKLAQLGSDARARHLGQAGADVLC